ncbi:MAG: DUF2723 domain-containing protein [Chloroflexi bacterium]|nr:DUF2723 domain-containing protein [Chloroflexota bacterium]MCI0580160.1 DUF2723 domain-containing protein [Chloroflexota bacterium]MCI0647449.1 DUF2723 domain-containing protein [Chloroflexota bacterium]MCI0729598.1 DUF2723 domain-containing protein [Chloroflexota bacterium]
MDSRKIREQSSRPLGQPAHPAVLWLARLSGQLDIATAIAFGAPFFIYLLTLAPTIYNLDSAELTTAAATGGVVRATGYPLYLVLGRLWSWLPVGDVGYRLNLFSAFSGALTIALAERILRRSGVGPWARAGALGLVATAPYFWALSLIAEVYTLHTALMAAVILLLLRWREQPTLARLAPAALLMALSLGNHLATVLLVPGCLWLVLATAPRQALRPRPLLVTMAAVLLGLSIYLTIPLRYAARPAFNYAGWFQADGAFVPVNLASPFGLWWLVSGRAFAGQMFAYQGADIWRETLHFGEQLWIAFFALGIGPGLLGLGCWLRRDWRAGSFLLLAFVANAAFYINYRVVDKATMFLPAYLVWALWLGLGYQVLLEWVQQAAGRPVIWLARGALLGVVLLALATNWPLVDRSEDWSTRQRGEAILQVVEPNALVLGWWDTVPVVEYLQLVEGQRPDVTAINRFLISGEDLEQLIRREVENRPVYINTPPASLLHAYKAVRTGPVYQLLRVESNEQ